MCGIVGIMGNSISNDLKEMLGLLKHRGPDDSGIWINNQLIQGDIPEMDFPDSNFGLGHNLLSIVGCQASQPIVNGEWVLVCNGEIYNFRELKESLSNNSNLNINSSESDFKGNFKDKFKTEFKTDSDCEIVINLTRYYENYYDKNILENKKDFNSKEKENIKGNNSDLLLIESLKMAMRKMDGDYAFALWDGSNLALARDPVGVKPLYYGKNNEISAFASERKVLWKLGIKEVNSLPPGHILVNDNLVQAESLFDLNIDENESIQNVNTSWNSNKSDFKNSQDSQLQFQMESFKKSLKFTLEKSVEKRILGLEKVGLIFSGGVDSTILASILKVNDIETTFYTVGTENSSDLEYAKKAAEYYDLKLRTLEIDENVVRSALPDVLEAIEEFNVMKIGVAMPIFLSAKMAHEDKLKVVFSGQGADELFGGYHRYLKDYSNHGDQTQEILKSDIQNIYHVNLQRDDAATMAHGVELRVPFLDKEVIKLAFEIPIEFKIKNKEDPLRKYILRQVALDMGVPEFIANRPKKAAQYGSGVHKILIKKVLKDFDEETFMKKLRTF